MGFQTKLLHGSFGSPYQDGATLPPISQVNAFTYSSSEKLARVFENKAPGYAYTRISNPTISALEQRVAELEGGIGAISCSSGMSAVTLALLNVLQAGDEVIASSGLFGGTIDLFEDLAAFGIVTRFTPVLTPETVEPLITDRTRVIFGEVISNPGLSVIDIPALSEFAHSRGIPLFLDNTTATPLLVNPLKLGADMVIHSASKYISGSGNVIAGIIVDSGRFKWDTERYPGFKSYAKLGPYAYLSKLRNGIWRNIGACLSPQNAYLCLLGIETLGLRMERICKNAEQLALALSETEGLSVNYPLLPDSPYSSLAKSELNGFGGGIITVRAGSKERAFKLIDSLRYACIATNIGDVRTLVIHPSSTIYLHSSEQQQADAGVYDDSIRISVGLEDVDDLIADFKQAIPE